MDDDIVVSETCTKSLADHGCHCDHWYDDLGCCWCENREMNLLVIGGAAEGSLAWLREQDSEFTKTPDRGTHTPTGMCGSRVKCEACPSDLCCSLKAGEEMKLIRERWDRCKRMARVDQTEGTDATDG
jgi:hypothetical protein